MPDWKLAILHYHLNRGGVTRVILGHFASLATLPASRQPSRVAVLFDGQAEHWPQDGIPASARFDVELVTIPELAYDRDACHPPRELSRELSSALHRSGCQPGSTVLHAHNHALGKNAALPAACRELAERGYHQLLQFHDFAEDLRPANYRHLAACLGGTDGAARTIYYHAPHVHYAVLNQRDARIFASAGLPKHRLHRLPNPVTAPKLAADPNAARQRVRQKWRLDDDRSFVLYPVRGIRRKNVGELLLWAMAFREDAFFAMTIPPRNPVEQPVYQSWVELARECKLPVDLAAAARDGARYDDLVAAADWEITTSVAEGFGLVFLESWLVGKPLLGRDLPEITADFREAGVELPALQSSVEIPWSWLDRDAVAASLRRHMTDMCEAYGSPHLGEAACNEELEELLSGATLDWAYLDQRLQIELLRRLSSQQSDWSEFWRANPVWSAMRTNSLPGAALIDTNRTVIESHYGLRASGRRLYDTYAQLLSASDNATVESLNRPASILGSFLQLRRLHPIRLA